MDKQQLIEQLRLLAAQDPQGLIDLLQNALDKGFLDKLSISVLQEPGIEYSSTNASEHEEAIKKIREKNFSRFAKVYKALS